MVDRKEVFEFIDKLDRSGIDVVNNALQMIITEFEINSTTAQYLLACWGDKKQNTQKRREPQW